MPQNVYDDPDFFAKYSQFRRSVEGLDGAAEWPMLQSMLPGLAGQRVLDLGCGFGWFCRWAREHGAASVVGVDLSERMLARALIDDALAAWVTDRVHDGDPAPGAAVEDATAAAVFAALFGLGRLQQWVDDEAIENIDVNGCDDVWLSYAGGHTLTWSAID